MPDQKQKSIDLYELMPVMFRIRDAERGYPLRAFLDVIGEQVDVVKCDVDQLWDDLFIETCRDWVIPYIGDLVGNTATHDVDQRRRADVAKTIFYRRRKGTLPMLEGLARDVTGWSAHAVAFFDRLAWTQNMNHLRRSLAPDMHRRVRNAVDSVGPAHVRNLDAMDRVDGPFDVTSHTVDVRSIAQHEGWHGIRNVGFFLWRLQNYPLAGVTPRQADPPNAHGFHFSPLGRAAPLFHQPRPESDEFALAGELHVRGPIRPVAFHDHLRDYYGPGNSLAIYRGPIVSDENLIPAERILCKRLDDWAPPPPGNVAVDVRLGRFAFAPGKVPPDGVTVCFNYGFSADIGGGPYSRRASLIELEGENIWRKSVAKSGNAEYSTLADALSDWADPNEGNKRDAIITITDNATYEEAISIEPGDRSRLVIQAGDRFRPHLKLIGGLSITGSHPDATLEMGGLLIEGPLELTGSLGELRLVHSTLVPGDAPSLRAARSNESLRVRLESCISGPLLLPTEMPGLDVSDSIIDGRSLPAISGFVEDGASDGVSTKHRVGPRATLERVTIRGRVHVKELELASEVIFVDPVIAERTQEGCVRFSYLPDQTSQTPRRYRCQPDLACEGVTCPQAQARIRARLRPAFTSDDYGDPGYGQLHLNAPAEIRTGAEAGSEMGAFEQLKQPQREANLKIRLDEYLPFGLEAGLIFVT